MSCSTFTTFATCLRIFQAYDWIFLGIGGLAFILIGYTVSRGGRNSGPTA
jgi:hypothetical protein